MRRAQAAAPALYLLVEDLDEEFINFNVRGAPCEALIDSLCWFSVGVGPRPPSRRAQRFCCTPTRV